MTRTGINNTDIRGHTCGPRVGATPATNGIGRCVASLVVLLIATVEVRAGAAPQINELSDATLARSGRLLILGTNFGSRQGEVLIDGLSAIATTWTDTEIHAYVPEAATLGSVPVEVTTAKGASDSVTLNVTMRPSGGASSGAGNRIRWRFQMDSQFSGKFITTAPDGTVYASDSSRLYALTPDGGLLWVASGAGGGRPISIGTDGAIYTAGNLIKAINPDGTVKWQFPNPSPGSSLLAAPNVGPDGNIYAMQDTVHGDGIGSFSLDSDGNLLWTNDLFSGSFRGSKSAIVFGVDRLFTGLINNAGSLPTLRSFSFDGDGRAGAADRVTLSAELGLTELGQSRKNAN